MILAQSHPSVSVIVPVYNGEKFLSQAIECIFKQNYPSLEIIIIDDGSSDNTAFIASQYQDKIRYFLQKNQGPATARNNGIKIAQGDIIAFLDVDDLWSDNKLNLQVGYLLKHPQTEICQGLIQQMQWENDDDDATPLKFKISSEPYQFLNLGSAVYRKSVFEKVGLFDENLWDNEDTDWFYSAWKANIKKTVLPEVTLYYRLHNCNMVLKRKDLVYHGLPKIMKKHMDIARKAGGFCHLKGKLPRFWGYIGIGKTPIKQEDKSIPLSVDKAKEKLKQFKQKLNLARDKKQQLYFS